MKAKKRRPSARLSRGHNQTTPAFRNQEEKQKANESEWCCVVMGSIVRVNRPAASQSFE